MIAHRGLSYPALGDAGKPPFMPDAAARMLEQLGHTVTEIPQTSGLNGVVIDKQGLIGAADPRREGRVSGE